MLAGILFISICVGCYRLSGFGVDAFTCMNLGISGFIGMSFGTWQLIINLVILIIVFFYSPQVHWRRHDRKHGVCRIRGGFHLLAGSGCDHG